MQGFSVFPLSQETVTQLTILLPAILLTLGLSFSVLNDAYIERRHRKIMLIICALVFVVIVQNCMSLRLETRYTDPFARTVCGIVGYSVRPVILVLFCHIVAPKRRFWPAWTLAGLNAAVYLTALFSPLAFQINEDNHFHRGPLNAFGFAVSILLLVWLLYLSIREFRSEQRRKNHILLLPVLMIVGSVYLDYQVGRADQLITFLTYAIVLSSVFYYIWLHLQFVREHEQDLMAAQRIRIMMTQIQPHFLFNALNTIRALYAKDPPLADRTLEDFSAYLRQNLESLSQTELVPVARELEHTRLYAEIEVLRFPNVRVEYQIEDSAFTIPSLTIQPLVENAIRHGVRSCSHGLVTVSAVRESGVHRITVRDNGVGFDVEKLDTAEGSHIGLRNVKDRIEQMCGGTMLLQSEIGKGTCVTLLIPVGNEADAKENRK